MKRQTKDQKIAALEADAENLRNIALEALRERDDARADLASITTSPADSRFCARLANVVFVDLGTAERNAVGVDDVAARVCALLATEEAAKELCQAVLEISNNAAPLEKQIEAAKLRVYDLQRTREAWAGLPSNYADWADWIDATTFEPADIDRMADLLELLGLSDRSRDYVLQSADMPTALAKLRA